MNATRVKLHTEIWPSQACRCELTDKYSRSRTPICGAGATTGGGVYREINELGAHGTEKKTPQGGAGL